MESVAYTHQSIADIVRIFNVDPNRGLTHEEVAARVAKYGKNEFENRHASGWSILARQFKSPFTYLLLAATILALGLGEITDSVFILVFIAINVFFGFYQEYHSEKTAELLAQLVVNRARVVRENKESVIAGTALVPGDIVIVQTGDIIPADLRFIEVQGLIIDESILSGESIPVAKTAAPQTKTTGQINDAVNIGFSGTAVMEGRARGIVCAIGPDTAIGDIGRLTAETKRISSFEKGLRIFSKFILRMVGVTLIFIFGANLLIKGRGLDISEFTIFAIALAISVIPEALPVVTTFSLSRGAAHLARRKVIVKRLSAIEDLGGIEVLCTDKTGTITENKLTVAEVLKTTDEDPLIWAALAAPFLKEKHAEPNNAFDTALWETLNAETRAKLRAFTHHAEIPFDPERKRNSVLTQNESFELISRGAPEAVIDRCTGLTPTARTKIINWCKQEGADGKRVISVAKKTVRQIPNSLAQAEHGLVFIGCISFIDPLKPTAIDAIKKANSLGVQLKIITGDAAEVAGAVGYKIGLIDKPTHVITGEIFERLPHDQQERTLREHTVFARVSPRQKFLLVKMLERNYEVGYLGEGINDAPALKIANVALVVDTAADIAREAADIILLKKNLLTIIEGIAEGRKVFANTIKYIKATLASNFGNFYAVAIASLLIDFLPLLPIQILLVNLLSDVPMIAIAGDTVDPQEITRSRSYDIKEIALIATMLGLVSTIFDFIFFALFYRLGPSTLQTNWFIASIITELVFLFSIRTRLTCFKSRRAAWPIFLLTGTAAITTVVLPFTHTGQTLFKFIRPETPILILIGGLTIVYFITTEIVKHFYYASIGNHHKRKRHPARWHRDQNTAT